MKEPYFMYQPITDLQLYNLQQIYLQLYHSAYQEIRLAIHEALFVMGVHYS